MPLPAKVGRELRVIVDEVGAPDADGDVDISDLAALLGWFGATCP